MKTHPPCAYSSPCLGCWRRDVDGRPGADGGRRRRRITIQATPPDRCSGCRRARDAEPGKSTRRPVHGQWMLARASAAARLGDWTLVTRDDGAAQWVLGTTVLMRRKRNRTGRTGRTSCGGALVSPFPLEGRSGARPVGGWFRSTRRPPRRRIAAAAANFMRGGRRERHLMRPACRAVSRRPIVERLGAVFPRKGYTLAPGRSHFLRRRVSRCMEAIDGAVFFDPACGRS